MKFILGIVFVLIASGAGAQTFDMTRCGAGGNPDLTPYLGEGKLCTSQTACCAKELKCENHSGWHCTKPTGSPTSTTTTQQQTTTTKASGSTLATSTTVKGTTLVSSTVTTTTVVKSTTTTLIDSCSVRRGSVRPTGWDVPITVKDPHLWWRGCQATQTERDAMIQRGLEFMSYAIRYGREAGRFQRPNGQWTTGPISQQADACENTLTETRTRFNCCSPYDDIGVPKLMTLMSTISIGPHLIGPKTNVWIIKDQTASALYDRPLACLKKIREASLSGSGSVACYNSALMTPELQGILDIRKSDALGRCVSGSGFAWPGNPSGKELVNGGPGDNGDGIADGDLSFPGISDSVSMNAFMAMHPAHAASTAFLCGRGPVPAVSVQAAHVAFENSPFCTESENKRRLCRMKEFDNVADKMEVDPISGIISKDGWTPQEICIIAELEDIAHKCWSDQMGASVVFWGAVRRCDTFHSDMHQIMNVKGDYLIHPPCVQGKGTIGDCPKYTGPEYIVNGLNSVDN